MIHEPAIDRIKESVDPEGFYQLFQALAEEAEEHDEDVGQVCMPYVDEGDEFVAGTWVPELWLVVRKVMPDANERTDQRQLD
jgi:hypothetical protein